MNPHLPLLVAKNRLFEPQNGILIRLSPIEKVTLYNRKVCTDVIENDSQVGRCFRGLKSINIWDNVA